MKLFKPEQVNKKFSSSTDPKNWTVVIPAAGRGSRLGFNQPKILYPINGRPILDWLIDLLEPYCQQFVFVLSPEGAPIVEPYIKKRLAGRYKIAIQPEPKGMADAVNKALPKLSTPYTLVIWGDQAGIQPATIRNTLKLVEFQPKTTFAVPIIEQAEPYVHYQQDQSGRLTKVLERREGTTMPGIGQSDCGVFAFQTKALKAAFKQELAAGIKLSQGTKEWNFLPMLPKFDTGASAAIGLRLDSPEETIGVNTGVDATKLVMPLRVVLFSGGSGTSSITEALLKYPDIELTNLVNAYDDGKSTGLIRRFIPGMLGPSDIRKVVSTLLASNPNPSAQALKFILDYRLPDGIAAPAALKVIDGLIHWHDSNTATHDLLAAKEKLSIDQARLLSKYLQAFVDYYHQVISDKPWFTFADNGVGNLVFGGCFLVGNQSFNQAIDLFADLAGVKGRILNLTLGENLALYAMKASGQLLDEAGIVNPQEAEMIEEIFLVPAYLDPNFTKIHGTKDKQVDALRKLETLPSLNPVADQIIREADVIIYGPGTQHSSLYPSYLTVGLAEAIRANKRAEKIFIANIARDYDILVEDASTLVKGFMANMRRKQTYPVEPAHLVNRFFFQKPELTDPNGPDYLPFDPAKFDAPLDQVVWIDMEGAKGKHAGGRTVAELLTIIETRLRRRIRHVPHKVSIIVPALNEAKTIRKVIQELADLQFAETGLEKEVIVIDGQSTDQTFEIAKTEPSVRAYQLETATGRGAALRLGIDKAKGDIIVFFPADGEYRVSDIPRIVSPLLSQDFPVVFGSRAFRSKNLSDTLHHVYGNRGISFLISKYGGMMLTVLTLLGHGRYISDTLTSVKGFNARALRGLTFRRTGVDFDMELIKKLARSGHAILEIPVDYQARTVEEGKKITIADGLKSLIALLPFSG